MGRKQCLTEPCALCRTRSLHEELLALRVQKDTKQEVGERLAGEQDSLFRKVRHFNPEQSFALHTDNCPAVAAHCWALRLSLFSSCRLMRLMWELGLLLMQAEERFVRPPRMSGTRWSS